MGNKYISRHPTRVLALAVGIAVVFGGSLPELGNIATIFLQIKDAHYFNIYFLVGGFWVSLSVVSHSVADLLEVIPFGR